MDSFTLIFYYAPVKYHNHNIIIMSVIQQIYSCCMLHIALKIMPPNLWLDQALSAVVRSLVRPASATKHLIWGLNRRVPTFSASDPIKQKNATRKFPTVINSFSNNTSSNGFNQRTSYLDQGFVSVTPLSPPGPQSKNISRMSSGNWTITGKYSYFSLPVSRWTLNWPFIIIFYRYAAIRSEYLSYYTHCSKALANQRH